MITCPKCSKENQDHYKFCLGCGAELPREASPKKFAAGTPPQGVPAVKMPIGGDDQPLPSAGPARSRGPINGPAPVQAAPAPVAFGAPPAPVAVAEPAPVVAAAPAPAQPYAVGEGPPLMCTQCEHPNPSSNKFCASCGFKLAKPVVAEQPVAPPAPPTSGIVLTALRADGSEAGTYALPVGIVTIGRDTGHIFAGDSYLSPRHATFTPRAGKLFVHDDASLNGVYKKLRRDEPVPIQLNDIFRIGQEILRFEPLAAPPPAPDNVERLGSPAKGYIGRLAMVIGRDATGNAYLVPDVGLHLGRERGDVLFPEDGYVSGLHCRLAPVNGTMFLTDLGSSNGSFVRISGDVEVVNGDILLMGQQLFRIQM